MSNDNLYDNPVLGDRGRVYGCPERNLGCQADLIDVFFKWRRPGPIRAWEVAIISIFIKLGRIITGAFHKDNYLDLRGYSELAEILQRDIKPGTQEDPKSDGPSDEQKESV